MTDERQEKGRRLLYAGVLLITFFVHLPSVFIPFQFDDFHHLAENPAIMKLSNLPRFFVDPSLFTGRAGEGMYRPLLMASHALCYSLCGMDFRGFHLFNLGLHLLNTALVMTLLRRWLGKDTPAAVAALWWAVAAVQHETVGYLCARSTLLASLFMLGAVLVTEEPRRIWKAALAAGAFFVLALLAKEIAFVLPLLLLLRDLTLGRERGCSWRDRWPIYAVTFAVWPLYLFLRFLLFSSTVGPNLIPRHLYLLTQTRVFFYYLAKIFYPLHLTLLPDQQIAVDLFSPEMLAAFIGTAAVISLGLFSFRRTPRIGFGIFWFGIALLPASSLVPLFLVASIERLYLPLLGLLVIGWEVFQRFFGYTGNNQRAAALVLLIVIAFNAAFTVSRHQTWQGQIRLMRDTVKNAPRLSTSWTWLGLMEIYDRRFPAAKKHLSLALRLNPLDIVAQENMGKLLNLMDSGSNARAVLERLFNDPTVPLQQKVSALFLLAQLDLKEKKTASAVEKARRVLELDPDNADAYALLGRAAEEEGDLAQAIENYQRAVESYPEFMEALTQLGIIAFKQGDLKAARQYLSRVAAKKKPWPEVYFHLGLIVFQEAIELKAQGWEKKAGKKLAEARDWFLTALRYDPEDAYANYGLGGYYGQTGDLETSRKYFEKAVAGKPDFIQARDFLARSCLDLARQNRPTEQNRQWYLEAAGREIRWLKAHPSEEARRLAAEREKEWTAITGRPLP